MTRPPRIRTQIAGVRVTALGKRLQRHAHARGGIALRPVLPSAALTAAYEAKLLAAVERMQRATLREVREAYKVSAPVMAMDASPAALLRRRFRKFVRRWTAQFDGLGPKLAEYFARAAKDRTDAEMRAMLRDAGFTVKFQMTRAMGDAYQAVIGENVALIKSVAERHLTNVQGLVMRSVQVGGDLQVLVDGLEKNYGVTRKRAQLIARTQTRMATATLVRARQLEIGVTKAKWLHSAGGKTPRPEHVAFSGKLYDVKAGHDFDNGEGVVWPGSVINCRCVSIPVIPGLEAFQ